MLRLKESMLNEPEFWLILLRVPPQAPDRSTGTPIGASVQCDIASPQNDGSPEHSRVTRHVGDSGTECKV